LREYEVSETFHHSEDEKRYEVVKSDQANSMNVLRGNDVIQQEIEEEVKEQEMLLNQHQTTALDDNLVPTLPTRVTLPSVSGSLGPGIIRKGGSEALLNSYVETYHRLQQQSHANKQKFKKLKGSRDCKVGEWGEWSACSAPCGSVGEMSRGRQIVRPARRSGAPCPPLRQVPSVSYHKLLDALNRTYGISTIRIHLHDSSCIRSMVLLNHRYPIIDIRYDHYSSISST
ncbi:unnamed protein product, partial [Nesidiocoris tenuis]